MEDQINLDRDDLIGFFIHHLDKVHSAKSHLLRRLPEILYQVHFSDLEEAIFETIKIVELQRKRMEEVYELMGTSQNDGRISGLTGLIDDSFEEIKIHHSNPELRDMSILFYMTNIEAVEMASFQVLQLMAVKIKNERIKELIKENCEDAKADKALMLLITTKYLSTV